MENTNRTEQFLKNQELIHYTIHKYCTNQKNYDDLYQVGAIELLRAIDNYDESKGKFSTYAINCIKHRVISESDTLRELMGDNDNLPYKIAKWIVKNSLENTNKDELYSLCKKEYGNKYVTKERFNYIYEMVQSRYNNKSEAILQTAIEDKGIYSVEDGMMFDRLMSIIKNTIKDEKHKDLYLEWLMSKVKDIPLPMKDLGDKYGISRQRVSEIIKRMNKIVGKEILKCI